LGLIWSLRGVTLEGEGTSVGADSLGALGKWQLFLSFLV